MKTLIPVGINQNVFTYKSPFEEKTRDSLVFKRGKYAVKQLGKIFVITPRTEDRRTEAGIPNKPGTAQVAAATRLAQM